MNYSYFCGVDISKQHLDFCLLDRAGALVIQTRCRNAHKGITKQLAKWPVDELGHVLFCAENTGMYGYHLAKAAETLGLSLWIEHPGQIKACSGLQRGKTDPADAFRIAQYSRRYQDRAVLHMPLSRHLQHLCYLQSERELLVGHRATYKGQLSDQCHHMDPHAYQQKARRLEAIIAVFDTQIADIDQRMATLIGQHQQLQQQNQLLQSIPGIGPRLALAVIILTKGFSRFDNPRAFCCYCGVAPFVWHSGDQVHTRGRVSHRADKRMKSLLHMGALAAIQCPGELQHYYRRKCKEGKHKMSVINAVRSKLVHRMFAVIKRGKPYTPIACKIT